MKTPSILDGKGVERPTPDADWCRFHKWGWLRVVAVLAALVVVKVVVTLL